MALLRELELDFFEQYHRGIGVFESGFSRAPQLFDTAENAQPSYRLAGGTSALVNALAQCIDSSRVLLNCPVREVSEQGDHLEITTSTGSTYRSRQVIFTLF